MKMSYDMQVELTYPEELTPEQLEYCSEAHIELMSGVYAELLLSGENSTSGTLYLYQLQDCFWSTKLLKQQSFGFVHFKIQCKVERD